MDVPDISLAVMHFLGMGNDAMFWSRLPREHYYLRTGLPREQQTCAHICRNT
jgi:hypothetical protein